MDYEKEYFYLKDELLRLEIEKEGLLKEKAEFISNLEKNQAIVNEASAVLAGIPKDTQTREYFKQFEKSKDVIKIEEFFKKHIKFFENCDNIEIDEDNNIILNNKIIGTLNDVRFSSFLQKVMLVLPFLVGLYARYGHFASIAANMDNIKYLGKEFVKLK